MGTAVAVPSTPFIQAESAAQTTFETFAPVEVETLQAIVARLIPTDAHGPGAIEAQATHYIDQALSNALAASRQLYADGLASIDAYARSSRGKVFRKLQSEDQDAFLEELEDNSASGFTPDSSSFFEMIRSHTIEGTFSDPYYGGNANFIGWDLIGYPGVRTVVTPRQQRIDSAPRPVHRSAYDFGRFVKEVLNRGR